MYRLEVETPEELQCSLELLKADADYFGIEGLPKIIGQRKTERAVLAKRKVRRRSYSKREPR